MNGYFLISFCVYFLILLTIGLLAHKKQTSSADFIMGNRSLNFWLVAISAHASDMSVWLFMGFPMAIFLAGLSKAWIAIGLLLGMYLNWHWVAPRLRSLTEKYDCYTLSSFFEKRFNDPSGKIRVLSAVMFVIFLTHYLSAGLIGMGVFLESLFGLNYYFGLSLAVLVVVAYTFTGGFIAVAWTDLFQGLFLLAMILIVPALAFFKIGDIETINQVAAAKEIPLSFWPGDVLSMLNMILLAISWGIGYFGMPHVITKFMSINSTSELKKSKWIGMTWQFLVLSAAIAVGLIAIAYFPEGLSNPQMVFIEMVKDLFHPLFSGFILCAVLAASMSTMDSQVLVCASVLSEDLYSCVKQHNVSSEAKLKFSRFSVLAVSLVALLLSLNKNTTIMETVSYSWAGLGSSFGPVVLSALFSKKANKYGAIAGILTGGSIVMIWPHVNPLILDYIIEPMIPGFFLSLLVIHGVSYATQSLVNESSASTANEPTPATPSS